MEESFDFKRYIDTIDKNFSAKSIHMLDSLDQISELKGIVASTESEIKSLNLSREKSIKT